MTTDPTPGVNAPTRTAKEAHDPLLTGEADLRPASIPPARAIAVAAIIRSRPHPLPHWLRWADELQQWGEAHIQEQP